MPCLQPLTTLLPAEHVGDADNVVTGLTVVEIQAGRKWNGISNDNVTQEAIATSTTIVFVL